MRSDPDGVPAVVEEEVATGVVAECIGSSSSGEVAFDDRCFVLDLLLLLKLRYNLPLGDGVVDKSPEPPVLGPVKTESSGSRDFFDGFQRSDCDC